MTHSDDLLRARRHALAKALGLWPLYGRLSLLYYSRACREICPRNPDAFKVGRRYTALQKEFRA